MISPFAARCVARPPLRGLLFAALALLMGACNQTVGPREAGPQFVQAPQYAALPNERFPVPAVDAGAIDPKYVKQRVRYATPHPTGTVVIDPGAKFLYLVMENGTAMRYGIGVGREGFGWSGTAEIRRKAAWPTWTPPAAMIRRQPELEPYRHGMAPSLENPLGARALYLFQNGKDTLYRIHGTNEPASIGSNVSSGCVRLINQDVIDLFNRLPVGSKVVVLPDRTAPAMPVAEAGANQHGRRIHRTIGAAPVTLRMNVSATISVTTAAVLAALAASLWLGPAATAQTAEDTTLSRDSVLRDPDNPALGNPKGDITIVEYFDYQCPYCKKVDPVLMRIARDDGNVRVVLKDWPIFGAASAYAARMVLAAKYQGKYAEAHAALIATTGKLTEARIREILAAAGVDVERAARDLQTHRKSVDALLARNNAQAEAFGFQGTPAFIVGTFRVPGVLDAAGFKQAIADARKAARQP